jgi:hypothetical protein
MRPLNIALADGSRQARESLRELLAGLGHHVVAVENGRQLVDATCASDCYRRWRYCACWVLARRRRTRRKGT